MQYRNQYDQNFKQMPENYLFIQSVEGNWTEASAKIYTDAGLVTVWRATVSALVPYLKELEALLNPTETARVQRYQQEKDRQARIISKAILRVLLGRYLAIDPKEVRFQSDKNKKPFVGQTNGNQLQFNISHSGDWILIAVSDTSVGIDLEQADASFNYQNMLSFSFSQPEINFIKQSDFPYQSFYQLWTRKECLLKATGTGLIDELTLIPSLDGVHQNPTEITNSTENWLVSSFKVDDNYVGSVAFMPVKTALQFFNFQL